MAGLYRAQRGEKVDGPRFFEMLDEHLDGLDPEDFRLYGGFLDAWLRADKGSDESLTAMVRLVRDMAACRELGPLGRELAVAALRNGKFSVVEGEENAFRFERGEQPISRAFLERYGAFLEARGYPSLARRVRGLAREPDPSPVKAAGAGRGRGKRSRSA